MKTNDEIRNDLEYHAPGLRAQGMHEAVRTEIIEVSTWANDTLPECDEKDEALKHLRLAMMWANAAIACHSDKL